MRNLWSILGIEEGNCFYCQTNFLGVGRPGSQIIHIISIDFFNYGVIIGYERSKKVKVKGDDFLRLSDLIEEYIKDLMNDNDEYTEFGRNELAQYFNCVPSQINYVIATRFSPERGYYVESRRGGGGNIKIKRINVSKDKYVMHIINSISNVITQQDADIIISNLVNYGVANADVAKIMRVAVNDKVLSLPIEYKDATRSRILKNMLLNLV